MRKKLHLLLIMLAWVSFAFADTYTVNEQLLKNAQFNVAGGTVVLSDLEWSYPSVTAISYSTNKGGLQVGASGNPQSYFTLTTSAFSAYKVKKITVNSSKSGSSNVVQLTASVGGNTSDTYTLTTSKKDYAFEFDNISGDIVISWTATERAYYIHSITIEYSVPADMLVVPAPVFLTPEGVYTDKVRIGKSDYIIFEVPEETGAVIYYTTDGTDPNPDDLDSGSTKTSKSYQGYEVNVTESMTIKAVAVVDTDEGVRVMSEISEATFVVSPKTPYVKASAVESGCKYAFVASDSVASPFVGKTVSGYLPSVIPVDIYDNNMETAAYNAFTFTSAAGGYTIQDPEGRYLYSAGSDSKVSVATAMPASGAVWSVAIDGSGKATITNVANDRVVYYSVANDHFGCYTAGEVTSDMELVTMYLQPDLSYTITPEPNSTHDTFQTITITSEQGIEAAPDFKATTILDEETVQLVCTQVDANTIALSFAQPLVRDHNTNLMISLSGSLIFDPTGLSVYKSMAGTRIDYILNGHVDTEILSVTPENNSTVVKLYYFLFTFSYYASATEDASITPRLYKEGTDRLYKVEYTMDNEDGDGFADMKSGAIRLLEPVTESGIYILEIPDGYFQADNKPVKGITLRYNLVYDPSGIADVVAKGENGWVVYNLNGVKVMEAKEAQQLNTLTEGIYIINGVKTIVR